MSWTDQKLPINLLDASKSINEQESKRRKEIEEDALREVTNMFGSFSDLSYDQQRKFQNYHSVIVQRMMNEEKEDSKSGEDQYLNEKEEYVLDELKEETDKEKYKKFFDKMLKKYGVDSPAELSKEKKKEFFDAVDKGWNSDDEPGEDGLKEARLKGRFVHYTLPQRTLNAKKNLEIAKSVVKGAASRKKTSAPGVGDVIYIYDKNKDLLAHISRDGDGKALLAIKEPYINKDAIKDNNIQKAHFGEDGLKEKLEKDSDDPCWDGYVQAGNKMKDGKEVPNCVPMNESYNPGDVVDVKNGMGGTFPAKILRITGNKAEVQLVKSKALGDFSGQKWTVKTTQLKPLSFKLK